jgi:hypothetical protein
MVRPKRPPAPRLGGRVGFALVDRSKSEKSKTRNLEIRKLQKRKTQKSGNRQIQIEKAVKIVSRDRAPFRAGIDEDGRALISAYWRVARVGSALCRIFIAHYRILSIPVGISRPTPGVS